MQSQFKIVKKSEKDAYLRKYPKNQVIQKEDLAKYLMSGIYLRPDLVSRGRAKNMTDFANEIDRLFKKDRLSFNEQYFKNAISYAILFKYIDKHVGNAEWYQKGGVKLNIVPYTLSKIIYSLPKGKALDLNRIWKEQNVYRSFIKEIDSVAKLADEFINDSKGVIPTEYAKKESTWNAFKEIKHKFSEEFLNDLISVEILEAKENLAKKDAMLSKDINIENEIYNLAQTENKKYWDRLLEEGSNLRLISLEEQRIIKNYICELAKPIPKRFPTPNHYKIAWKVREKLDDAGVLV